jgi:hypothetical protein
MGGPDSILGRPQSSGIEKDALKAYIAAVFLE